MLAIQGDAGGIEMLEVGQQPGDPGQETTAAGATTSQRWSWAFWRGRGTDATSAEPSSPPGDEEMPTIATTHGGDTDDAIAVIHARQEGEEEEGTQEATPVQAAGTRRTWWGGWGLRVRASADAEGATIPLQPEDSTGHAAAPDASVVVRRGSVWDMLRGGRGGGHHSVV